MPIITKEMIHEAIELSKPSALAILNHDGATWGPKGVLGAVSCVGARGYVKYEIGESPMSKWDPQWSREPFNRDPSEFPRILNGKLSLVMREKANLSVIVATRPWCIKEKEFLHVGGVYVDGIAAVATGAVGWADEAISGYVAATIRMLAFLDRERRIREKKFEI